jgi:molecular chaperone DnaJ
LAAADYYSLLQVSPNASDEEIRRAYRRLARELHPDASGGDPAAEDRFKQITVAYETLRDPERRRRYDMFGPDGARAGAGAPGGDNLFGANLGDLFETFFGSPFGTSSRTHGPVRGADAEVVLELSFEEAVFGTHSEVRLRGPVACSTCGGSGARPGTSPLSCPACNGTGEIQRVRQSILGQMVTASPCGRCRGRGEIIDSPCKDCRGDGRRTEERVFSVEVPAGVDDGSTLRLPGRGPAGPRGGPPGDLYVHLSVRPHKRFERSGFDLTHVLHIPVSQAALGTQLRVQTLEGTETLAIPSGTQTGQTFRLRGQGVPHLNSRGRGDLVITVVVDTPTDLTDEQEELLRRFAAARGEELLPVDEGLLSRIRSAFK